jgi:hypothetical protein
LKQLEAAEPRTLEFMAPVRADGPATPARPLLGTTRGRTADKPVSGASSEVAAAGTSYTPRRAVRGTARETDAAGSRTPEAATAKGGAADAAAAVDGPQGPATAQGGPASTDIRSGRAPEPDPARSAAPPRNTTGAAAPPRNTTGAAAVKADPGRDAASPSGPAAVTTPVGSADRPAAASASPRPAPDAQPPDGREDAFPLWPDAQALDGPTVPIAVKPQGEPAAAKTAPGAGPDDAWQAAEIQMMRGGRKTTTKAPVQAAPKRIVKKSRPPALGLSALVLLGLLAGFFGWVSADPFWLAIGHAQRGTATVTKCAGNGLDARCVGTFQAAGFSRDRVAVSALPQAQQRPGVKVPAQMVSAQGRIAYAGPAASLHLRWIVGIALVLLCGLGIAWATGVRRLESPRARLVAFAMSLGGPLLLTVGAVAVAW